MAYSTIVSADILSQNLDNPSWVILDCRDSLADKEWGYQSYLEGHIPNANLLLFIAMIFHHPLPPLRDVTPYPKWMS